MEPEIKQIHLPFLQVREGVGEAKEESFLLFVATLLLSLSPTLSLSAGLCRGLRACLKCQKAAVMVSSPGCTAAPLPAVQRREIKRDWDSTLTGLTQFIWKFSGENMSNKDKNSDSKEQM